MIKNSFKFIITKFSFSNFKNNFWIFFSMCVLFVSNAADLSEYIVPFGFGAVVVFASIFFVDKKYTRVDIKASNKKIFFLSVLSSIAVSFFYAKKFYSDYSSGGNIISYIGTNYGVDFFLLLKIIAILIFIMLIPLFLIFNYHIYDNIKYTIKKALNHKQLLIVSIIPILIFSAISAYYFYLVNYHMETAPDFDIVYTSDSPFFLKNNVWMNIYNSQNDLRQPLFGLFSIPLVAPFYLIGVLISMIGVSEGVTIALAESQVFILILAYIMLSSICNKNSQLGLFCILSCSYMTVLASVMPEQYVCAVFWLIFLLKNKFNDEPTSKLGIIASTGSLLTSGICILTLYDKKKSIRENIGVFLNIAFLGGICTSAIGQLKILTNIVKKLSLYGSFMGQNVSIFNKLIQYTAFPVACLLRPQAGITTVEDHYSWQLIPQNSLNTVGLIIIILSIVSFIVNRKNKFAKTSICWIAFSFLLLFILGWGTAENGLILYSLYFGWAFIILLHLLIEKIFISLKIEKLIMPLEVLVSICLLIVNIMGIKEIILFSIKYYPAI